MSYQQNLPTYTHKFLSYCGWIILESPHYIFYFTAGSEAVKDIEIIKNTQEAAFEKIITTLTVPIPDTKIRYYIYPDQVTKKELMGDEWYAQSIYNELCIHVLYTKEDKPIGPHEDTHLLTLPWGLSWNFIQEGLAEHMVGHAWDGTLHTEKVNEGIVKGYELKPSLQLSSQAWYDTPDDLAIYYYSLAGSWVTFLIDTFGLKTFELFYRNTNRDMSEEAIKDAYTQFFNTDIHELEQRYFTQLDTSL